jgi:diacylglycerol kinase (ATP)
MRKAALIYNPMAGQKRHLRMDKIHAAAEVLRSSGAEVSLVPTEAAGSAGAQAAQAVASGHDCVFACGGDGTLHEVLQGMISGGGETPLGVVPLGTGNVVANDLRLPRDPVEAVRAQLRFEPRKIAAGQVEFQSRNGGRESRWFISIASVGVDAEMLYRVTADMKHRYGMLAYYVQGARLAAMPRFQRFAVEFTQEGTQYKQEVCQFMAVRVSTFPGIVGRLAPGAALDRDDVQLGLFRTGNRIRHTQFFVRAAIGREWTVPGIDLVHATEARCEELPDKNARRVYVEADGEFLGGLPVAIKVVPQAFTLLMPPR